MKDIKTLIPDIYSLVKSRGWFNEEHEKALSTDLANRLRSKFNELPKEGKGTLRLSRMGEICPCALWHSVHRPDLAVPVEGWTEIKFSYGHILEAFVITLAKAAGHEVTGEQDELNLDGIVGHRDCVIDGCTVDVKSANSRSFNNIKNYEVDPFIDGYLDQLSSYTIAGRDDPLVRNKNTCYIFAINQELGHLFLRKHEVNDAREKRLRERAAEYKSIVDQPHPPACECREVPFGTSGNVQLDLKARYSPYRYCCHPTLRTFIYAAGPVHLTRVVKKPDVKEVDRLGNIIYN